MVKRTFHLPAWIAIALFLASCGGMPDRYLDSHIGEVTEDEVADKLGEPTEATQRPTGQSEWMYRQYVVGHPQECAQYRLTFDARKVLREWMREPCG
jgi:hypothetical protein